MSMQTINLALCFIPLGLTFWLIARVRHWLRDFATADLELIREVRLLTADVRSSSPQLSEHLDLVDGMLAEQEAKMRRLSAVAGSPGSWVRAFGRGPDR